MLPSFMSKPMTARRYPKVSDHGSQRTDYSAAPELTVSFWGDAQPGANSEDEVNRDGRLVEYTVYAGPDSGVRDGDLVPVGGKDFRVAGEPERWRSGVLDHDVIRLVRWEG